MDVNEHVRPSKFIHLYTNLSKLTSLFIADLHFTVTVGSSTMSKTRTLK